MPLKSTAAFRNPSHNFIIQGIRYFIVILVKLCYYFLAISYQNIYFISYTLSYNVVNRCRFQSQVIPLKKFIYFVMYSNYLHYY